MGKVNKFKEASKTIYEKNRVIFFVFFVYSLIEVGIVLGNFLDTVFWPPPNYGLSEGA